MSKHLFSAQVVDPGIDIRTLLLTRGELPDVSTVLEHAVVPSSTAPRRPVTEVTVEQSRGVNLIEWFWEPCPGNELLRCDKVDIRKCED